MHFAALRKKKNGLHPFFFFFFFFFFPAEFSPSSPSVESIISFNTLCKVRNIDRKLGHNSQCATENQISHCRCGQLNFPLHFSGTQSSAQSPLQMRMMRVMMIIVVCGEELPSSPSSSLSLSSSVCSSNCFVTSPTPPASPPPSASFVPAAKSHTVVHACAGEHARAQQWRACTCMACAHGDTHGDTQPHTEGAKHICGSE